jgi:hypothetical protein
VLPVKDFEMRVKSLCEDLHADPLDGRTQRALLWVLLEASGSKVLEQYKRRMRTAVEDLAADPSDSEAQHVVVQLITGIDVHTLMAKALAGLPSTPLMPSGIDL